MQQAKFGQIFGLSSLLLGMAAIAPVSAQEAGKMPIPLTQNNVDPLTADVALNEEADQVTSVSQLTDVRPTDWAYQALKSLVERYGCIVGYPDKTYRGNRALSRWEFAAGLNACLDKIQELIAAATADFVRKEDLETVKKLQDLFAAELASLRGRVDALEVRTATLEKQQFSTTTRLNGEVVVAGAGILTGDNANGQEAPTNAIWGDRVRLNFDASFTGADLLRVRLQAVNLPPFSSVLNTPEGDIRAAGPVFSTAAENNNSVGIDALLYQFPVGEKLIVTLEANAGAIDDFTDTINPFLDGDGGSGALTGFATRNHIYYLLNGTGLGLRYVLSDQFEISAGYLATDAANPNQGGGLFNGPFGTIAQLTIKPSEVFALGLTYIHAYNNDFTANGSGGSNRASLRAALLNNPNLPEALAPFAGLDVPTSTNAYGVQASFQISPQIVLNGWVGYTKTRTLATRGVLPRGELDIWNWAVGLALPDLFKPGSLGGIIVGMEPRVTGVTPGLRSAIGRDRNMSFHVEAFYQYRINDNISITPGIIWLTNPDFNSSNSDVVIGAIRTTFTF
ncbi:iron uptake porin [Leptodesmis sichuanensis]|uniref:iron uptake porin n=1 Tax=Leptodesmis sichuanensis TaxID=2906798 RepID=UPI001F1F4D0C|nr:iron uptake porin [Leptodesmis sichuanensis]UIE36383.1 carbohydrate porin [Leptodesmis sichuanensis A121]